MLGESERDVRGIGLPGDVEVFRAFPDVLVAVRRRVEQAEVVALLDLLTADLDVVERGAAHVRDR